MSFVYLCSPYSHPDPAVREERFQAVCRAASQLMLKGYRVFSPIAHSHPIAEHLPEKSLGFWIEQDAAILAHADTLVILMLDGWKESRGIAAEMRLAHALGIKIEHLEPED
jgi:nucleoside 2-deoxyribosyltransferase